MKKTIRPGCRFGSVQAPASKSQVHRLLICAALGQRETDFVCDTVSRDIRATIDCLCALGAKIREEEPGRLRITPIRQLPREQAVLPCGESGSTLRFLLPVAGALGVDAVFLREGRLPQRPLGPLEDALREHGMEIWERGAELIVRGKLTAGDYTVPGDISSQYVSGLLFALPLLDGESRLRVTGQLLSAPYIAMTERVLSDAGICWQKTEDGYQIPGPQRPALPAELRAEGDWSNAAVYLCMGALSTRGILVTGLDRGSAQGDRAILEILGRFGAEIREENGGILVRRGALRGQEIDVAQIPDLVPPLSVLAAAAAGESRIVNAGRLRIKESDRLRSTADLLTCLGALVEELPEALHIVGRDRLRGGVADSWGDHRIAMSAALAASFCESPVEICGAESVEKSYPRFWEDFETLEVEQR